MLLIYERGTMPPPKQMPLQNIKAGRQPAGGAFDSQDAASGTGLGPPPGAKNKNLGELRMNSVMGTKSQDRIMAAEYKRSIEAVGKGGLAALSQDEGQEDTGPSDKQKDRNPFWQHQASFSNFASIVDQGERQKIAWALSRLDEFANAHESLLGQGSQLTHSEMISGMLFDEEELVPVPPLTCTYFKKVLVESGTTKEARFGVKVYMTNRRLILMDAEVVRMPTLDDTLAPEDKTMFLRTRYEVQVQVGDRSWYYPVPLNQLKGVSLDIHYGTRASGYLSQRRPIYHIAVLATAGLALLYYTLQEILARTDSLGATYDEVSDNFDAAGDVVGKGENLNKDEEVGDLAC